MDNLGAFKVRYELGDVTLAAGILYAVTLGQLCATFVVEVGRSVDESGVASVADGGLGICLVTHGDISLVVSMFSRRDPTGLPTDSYQSSYYEATGKSYHLTRCVSRWRGGRRYRRVLSFQSSNPRNQASP